jgi:nicotinamidase-related amidase
MPVTALDPRTALVVIDLQKGIAGNPALVAAPAVVDNARRLARAFRAKPLPVVLVTVGPSPDGLDALRPRAQVVRPIPPWTPEFSELLPGLHEPGDLRVHKRNPSAFFGTELDLQLRRRGVTGIVLCGIATSIGVDSTARAAHERGYNVTFASDAMCDMDPECHEFELRKILPRLGEIDTTESIAALLG